MIAKVLLSIKACNSQHINIEENDGYRSILYFKVN